MDEILGITNLVIRLALPVGTIAAIAFACRLPWINAFSIPLFADLPFDALRVTGGALLRFEAGLLDPDYQAWLRLDNLSMLLSLLVFVLILRVSYQAFSTVDAPREAGQGIPMSALGLVALAGFVASWLILAVRGMGISAWIFDTRNAYQLGRVGLGAFYAAATTLLGLALTGCMIGQRTVRRGAAVAVALVGASYFLGSKGFLLEMFVGALAIAYLRGVRIPLGMLPVLAAPVLALMLANFGTADLFSILQYFDYYTNSALIYQAMDVGQLQSFQGEVFLSKLWGAVPRGIVEDKPFVYGIVHLTEYLYPGMAAKSVTPGLGGPITSFSDWGVLGVAVGAMLDPATLLVPLAIGYVAGRLSSKGIDRWLADPVFVFLVIALFSPSLTHYLTFPLDAVLLLALFAGLYMLQALRVRPDAEAVRTN